MKTNSRASQVMIVAWLLCMPSWAVSRDWYVATNATPTINRPWMAGAVDLFGMPRILHGVRSTTVDMGAFETPPVPGSMLQFQ